MKDKNYLRAWLTIMATHECARNRELLGYWQRNAWIDWLFEAESATL